MGPPAGPAEVFRISQWPSNAGATASALESKKDLGSGVKSVIASPFNESPARADKRGMCELLERLGAHQCQWKLISEINCTLYQGSVSRRRRMEILYVSSTGSFG